MEFDGNKLNHALRASRITARSLADKVGCSENTMSRIRQGRLRPSRKLAASIEAALALPPGSLHTPGETIESLMPPDADEKELLTAFRKLPYRRRLKAIGMVEALLGTADEDAAKFGGDLRAGLGDQGTPAKR
jgi:transcriptional regulator with XRE-family HTH domain